MRVYSLLVLCALAANAQPAADKPKIIYRWDVQKSGVNDDLLSVSFVNRQLGYAGGKHNTILKTTDGGATWTRLLEAKESPDILSVMFSSPTDGWALGSALLHTNDGGESWQPAVPLPGPPGFGGGSLTGATRLQLHVHNMGVGVFRSEDGGRTWKLLGEPPSNAYTTVFFADAQHGWVGGDYGLYALTVDGGATWKTPPLPSKLSVRKIQFVSPQVGWLLPSHGHQGGPLGSTDGGMTWTSEYAGIEPYRPLEDMQFLNAQTGFLLAEENRSSVVLATMNGGKSWKTIGAVEKYSRALSFPEADEGWVVGPKGYIVHYHKVVLSK
jgi:photosystem II stability/assembly factor-like uncharacterized protein